MVQYFYVLFNKEKSAFYVKDPQGYILYSNDIILAEKFPNEEAAKNSLKYFRNHKKWAIKKATVNIEL